MYLSHMGMDSEDFDSKPDVEKLDADWEMMRRQGESMAVLWNAMNEVKVQQGSILAKLEAMQVQQETMMGLLLEMSQRHTSE
jgi:TnpA family transposase